jgi:hypothetical protein
LIGTRAPQLWQQVKNRFDFDGYGSSNPATICISPQDLPALESNIRDHRDEGAVTVQNSSFGQALPLANCG